MQIEEQDNTLFKSHETVAQNDEKAALLLRENRFTEALECSQNSLNQKLKQQETSLPIDELSIAISYYQIGLALFALAKYDEALTSQQESLKLRIKVLGENSNEVASCMDQIGKFYSKKAQYDQAYEWYDKALNIRKNSSTPEEYYHISASYSHIGGIFYRRGDYNQALEYYNKAFETLNFDPNQEIDDLLSEESGAVIAKILHNMGLLHKIQGKFDDALGYFNKALTIRKNIYHEKHVDIADSLCNIGSVYSSKGQYEKALEYYNEAAERQKQIFNLEHPEVAKIYFEIALVLNKKGQYDKTLEIANDILRINLGYFTENHPSVAAIYNLLATIQENKGNYEEALKNAQKSLDIRLAIFGELHVDTGRSYMALASIFLTQKDFPEAIKNYIMTKEIFEKIFGEKHPLTAIVLSSLGLAQLNSKQVQKGTDNIEKALHIQIEIFGPDFVELCTIYKALGFAHLMHGRYFTAQQNYEHALSLCQKGFGPTHPSLVSVYEHLAFLNSFQDVGKGIRYYTQAVRISNMHLDQGQPRLMNCYLNIAKLIIRFRDLKEAQNYLKKVLRIQRNSKRNEALALQAEEKLQQWEIQQIQTDLNLPSNII